MSQIVANRIRTPDGTILQSYHRHDYKEYTDRTNGLTYMVDGGLSYLRRNLVEYEELSLTTESPFQDIREAFCWGTRGKSGKEPLTWKRLCDLDTDHIQAILTTQQPALWLEELFNKELQYREGQK